MFRSVNISVACPGHFTGSRRSFVFTLFLLIVALCASGPAQEAGELREVVVRAIAAMPHNCETVQMDYTTVSQRPNVAVHDEGRSIIVPVALLDEDDRRRNPMIEIEVDRYIESRGGGWRTVDKISVVAILAEPDELFVSDLIARVNETPLHGAFELPQTQDMGHETVGLASRGQAGSRRVRTVISPGGSVTSFNLYRDATKVEPARWVTTYLADEWASVSGAVLDIRYHPLSGCKPTKYLMDNRSARWELHEGSIRVLIRSKGEGNTGAFVSETFDPSTGHPTAFVNVADGIFGSSIPDVETSSQTNTQFSNWVDIPGVGTIPRSIHRVITIIYDGETYPFSDELTIVNSISADVDPAFFDVDAILALHDFRGEDEAADPDDSFLAVGRQ